MVHRDLRNARQQVRVQGGHFLEHKATHLLVSLDGTWDGRPNPGLLRIKMVPRNEVSNSYRWCAATTEDDLIDVCAQHRSERGRVCDSDISTAIKLSLKLLDFLQRI